MAGCEGGFKLRLVRVNLPDFSRAGYGQGEPELPYPAVVLDVREFGAVGGGVNDDAQAFQAALDAVGAEGGVVEVAAGRWRIESTWNIRSSRVVLRGAGSNRTILQCSRSLTEILGGGSWGQRGGLLRVWPPSETEVRENERDGEPLVVLERASPAGSRLLAVPVELAGISPGEWLRLEWFDERDGESLLDYLFGETMVGVDKGWVLREPNRPIVRDWVQVVQVRPGILVLAQPIRVPVRPEWSVTLSRYPCLEDVGIEGLSIEFPDGSAPLHHEETGYNGVEMYRTINSWVRDLRVRNGDVGLTLTLSKNVTARDLLFTGTRRMHIGIRVSHSSDCLIEEFSIEAPAIHSLQVLCATHRSVFSRGSGWRMNLDAHRQLPFEVLYTDLDILHGSQTVDIFDSGGTESRGPHAGRKMTYWNIRNWSTGPGTEYEHGPLYEWPEAHLIGLQGDGPTRVHGLVERCQAISHVGEAHPVANLFAYRRSQRLAGRAAEVELLTTESQARCRDW
jgi:hypothetical protein